MKIPKIIQKEKKKKINTKRFIKDARDKWKLAFSKYVDMPLLCMHAQVKDGTHGARK